MRALALVVFALLLAPASAWAQGDVQTAANALKSDPVYVDPDAELADQVDADALRARIKSAGAAPMFIAVLPASAVSDSAGRTLIALRQAVGQDGHLRARASATSSARCRTTSTPRPAGDAARAAHPDDLQATLNAFIDRDRAREADAGSGWSSSAVAVIVVVLVLLLVAAGGALPALQPPPRPRDTRDGRSEVGQIDQSDEFVRLGDSIRALELDVTLGDGNAAAKADYDRAVEAYDRANDFNRKGATRRRQPGPRRGPGRRSPRRASASRARAS